MAKKPVGSLTAAMLEPAATPAPVPALESKPVTVTVKLDGDRYRRLKTFGLNHRRTNQDVMVAALDEYLKAHGA